ncbi:hypothetical protein [Listeria newyorkensis]|uniref:Uncharacterized protein n=1 Tax=Listeria newyorkensis TaxID=1497681 RepID=A0A841Z120_9LIST|nr:hypothetical protein [Listeria newyorkensis]MBC1459360.1 hypothetical protein [Listeria newyorkensis]
MITDNQVAYITIRIWLKHNPRDPEFKRRHEESCRLFEIFTETEQDDITDFMDRMDRYNMQLNRGGA